MSEVDVGKQDEQLVPKGLDCLSYVYYHIQVEQIIYSILRLFISQPEKLRPIPPKKIPQGAGITAGELVLKLSKASPIFRLPSLKATSPFKPVSCRIIFLILFMSPPKFGIVAL